MSFHIPAHKSGTAGQVSPAAELEVIPRVLDFQRVRYANVTFVYPRSEAARQWCESNVLLDDAARNGSAYVVENTLIDALWAEIVDADFTVK